MSDRKAIIVAPEGTSLTAAEKALFKKYKPSGFILFARNLQNSTQIKALTAELQAVVGGGAAILIDEEGGHVQRLPKPEFPDIPAAAFYGHFAAERGIERACRTLQAAYKELAINLRDLGINTNCAPVLDLAFPEQTEAIGTRAFSDSPEIVAALGKTAIQGLKEGGVTPVIKHIPGHGRALIDSHKALPHVETDLETLRQTDFIPFKACASQNFIWGMTAHITYDSIDADNPATQSAIIIEDIIRGELNFKDILLSDDISMEALEGSLIERAQKSLDAGCDIALHCSGVLEEMSILLENMPKLFSNRKGKFS